MIVGIVDYGSTVVPAIALMVRQLGHDTRILPEMLTGAEECEAFILSGSPRHFSAQDMTPIVAQAKKALFLPGRPCLGICFGHQLISIAHGGHVDVGTPVRTVIPVDVEMDVLFTGLPSRFEVFEDHTEGASVPQGFTKIASSDSYKNEAMRCATRPIWGVQFHPELSGSTGQQILANFLEAVVPNLASHAYTTPPRA